MPFGNNCTHNKHKLHSLSLMRLLPIHTGIHVITYISKSAQ